jgi:hypothetical protein
MSSELILSTADAIRCRDALVRLSKASLALRTGLKVSKWRRALSALVDPVIEARNMALEASAQRADDGESPLVSRDALGRLTFTIDPADEYRVEKAFDEECKKPLAIPTIGLDRFTSDDFPATVKAGDFTIEPEIVEAMLPIFNA